ncbi:MAG: zinc dependent phospholipase C family protein, partial [Dehalococcoidia bacterium]
MPNLLAHIHIGLQAVERLSFPFLERNLGSLLLGCTSPDIRIITKGKRDETHFAPLNIQRVGEGVENLLRRYPRLRDARSLSEPTRAFLAGYISHLVADEVWVLEIYRPYFANPDPFSNRAQANLWDRALQLELDRQAR